jgi:hypothetical protein
VPFENGEFSFLTAFFFKNDDRQVLVLMIWIIFVNFPVLFELFEASNNTFRGELILPRKRN